MKMPSNPNKDLLEARKSIAKTLMTLEENQKAGNLSEIVLAILMSHPVSDSWPERFIKKHFVKNGRFELKGDILRPVGVSI